MAATRTGKYIITEQTESMKKKGSRALSIDDDIIKGSFRVHFGWFMKPPVRDTDALTTHTHDFDEIIAFSGRNAADWRNLGRKVELWLDGEQHIFDKTCIVFIPQGMKHCPMIIERNDSPISILTACLGPTYIRNEIPFKKEEQKKKPAKGTGKYIVTERTPAKAARNSLGLEMGDEVVKGSFFLSAGWFAEPTTNKFPNAAGSHSHPCDEVIAFFGSDVDNWQDLGGEVELWLDGEKHILTKSCLVFVPKGMKHCPLIVHRVDRPIFHFTTGPATTYSKK